MAGSGTRGSTRGWRPGSGSASGLWSAEAWGLPSAAASGLPSAAASAGPSGWPWAARWRWASGQPRPSGRARAWDRGSVHRWPGYCFGSAAVRRSEQAQAQRRRRPALPPAGRPGRSQGCPTGSPRDRCVTSSPQDRRLLIERRVPIVLPWPAQARLRDVSGRPLPDGPRPRQAVYPESRTAASRTARCRRVDQQAATLVNAALAPIRYAAHRREPAEGGPSTNSCAGLVRRVIGREFQDHRPCSISDPGPAQPGGCRAA